MCKNFNVFYASIVGLFQKCVKQNMKESALADLKKDDWKCYVCFSRPLFGCRTICWAAQEINKLEK